MCSPTWKRGSAEDYARIFGGSGRTGTIASTNCAVAAYRSSVQRSPLVHRRGSDACQDTRRSNRPCATATSTRSASPASMSLSKLNPVEPPWYVTRMPGGVGRVASRSVPLSRLFETLSHRFVLAPANLRTPRQRTISLTGEVHDKNGPTRSAAIATREQRSREFGHDTTRFSPGPKRSPH